MCTSVFSILCRALESINGERLDINGLHRTVIRVTQLVFLPHKSAIRMWPLRIITPFRE